MKKVYRNSGGPPVEYGKDGKPLHPDGQFEVGDPVEGASDNYSARGIVVAKFRKLDCDLIRYVVQNSEGVLYIFSGSQLEEPS